MTEIEIEIIRHFEKAEDKAQALDDLLDHAFNHCKLDNEAKRLKFQIRANKQPEPAIL